MRAYERLLHYVTVHTTSDPHSGDHPSAARELDLAYLLVEELKGLGVENAYAAEHGYVYASLPATPGCEDKPALGLIAHMDTAPDASGKGVRPVLHEHYNGKDVTLPGTGAVMKVSTFPFLASMKGETLITTDGTTLLGADDKAGVAEILTAVETLLTENLPHGKLCIGFTPDEEIGEGALLFDIPGFGADFAYTVDLQPGDGIPCSAACDGTAGDDRRPPGVLSPVRYAGGYQHSDPELYPAGPRCSQAGSQKG